MLRCPFCLAAVEVLVVACLGDDPEANAVPVVCRECGELIILGPPGQLYKPGPTAMQQLKDTAIYAIIRRLQRDGRLRALRHKLATNAERN